MCISWFNKLFKKKPEPVERAVVTREELPDTPTYRVIETSRGGLNMPKYQPCPMGHGWKRRYKKTAGGAYYWCGTCEFHFFVGYPGGIMIQEA